MFSIVKSMAFLPQLSELSMSHSPQRHVMPPATLWSVTSGAMIGRNPFG